MVLLHSHHKKIIHLCLTGPLQNQYVMVFVFLQSGLYFLTLVQREETSEMKTWKSLIIFFGSSLNVLNIIIY